MTPYEDKTLKDSIKDEKKKLKDMSFRDKIWYIWEYYKFPIMGVVIGVFLIASIGTAIYGNRFETALSCVILNAKIPDGEDTMDAYFNQGFRQYSGIAQDVRIEVDASINLSFEESSMNEFTYAQLAKISAMVSSKELDVMIGPPDIIDHYGAMGGYEDLKQLLPADVYEAVKTDLYFVADQETGEERACGLSLENTDFAPKTGLILENPVLGIVSNSTHTDAGVQLIRYLYGL